MATPELMPIKAEPEILTTPLRVLERMIEKDLNPETLAKLLELQITWEKREAEKAFVAAVAAFKASPPELVKNKKVNYTNRQGQVVEYKHATLDRVTTSIGAALAQHELEARWRTEQKDGRIRVTCILRHAMGHSEETSLEGPPDDSGSKNPIQQIASTVTYLERYTLLAITGMATADDADGITFGDIEESVTSVRASANLDELQERFNKNYKRAHAAKNQNAMAILIHEKDERKRQLSSPEEAEFASLCEKKGLNFAQRTMLRAKHPTLKMAIEEVRGLPDSVAGGEPPAKADSLGPQPEPAPTSLPVANSAAPSKKGKQPKKDQRSEGTTTTAPSSAATPNKFAF